MPTLAHACRDQTLAGMGVEESDPDEEAASPPTEPQPDRDWGTLVPQFSASCLTSSEVESVLTLARLQAHLKKPETPLPPTASDHDPEADPTFLPARFFGTLNLGASGEGRGRDATSAALWTLRRGLIDRDRAWLSRLLFEPLRFDLHDPQRVWAAIQQLRLGRHDLWALFWAWFQCLGMGELLQGPTSSALRAFVPLLVSGSPGEEAMPAGRRCRHPSPALPSAPTVFVTCGGLLAVPAGMEEEEFEVLVQAGFAPTGGLRLALLLLFVPPGVRLRWNSNLARVFGVPDHD
jgi:hypothetical protein